MSLSLMERKDCLAQRSSMKVRFSTWKRHPFQPLFVSFSLDKAAILGNWLWRRIVFQLFFVQNDTTLRMVQQVAGVCC